MHSHNDGHDESFDTVQLEQSPITLHAHNHHHEEIVVEPEHNASPPPTSHSHGHSHKQHNHHHHHHEKKHKHNHSKKEHKHVHGPNCSHSNHSHHHHEEEHDNHHHHERIGQMNRNVQRHVDESSSMDSNAFKLSIMIVMVASVFVVELFIGFMFHSLTLLSDAFHMLSDVASLIIALVAMWLASRPKTDKLSYGYSRAEVIGGLVNGVFLLSAVMFIYLESLEAIFLEDKEVTQPWTILGIGCIGLTMNLFGLIMFGVCFFLLLSGYFKMN
jgi:cation transport ATPase